jgi:Domain of unknown function (DUF4232)
MTGEHAVMYALTNHGSRACGLKGYPQVTLYDAAGAALPVRIAHGGAYVTSKKPGTVLLAPGLPLTSWWRSTGATWASWATPPPSDWP